MQILTSIDLLAMGVAIAAMGFLGFIVYFNNRESITNRTFLYVALTAIVWGIFNYLLYQYSDPNIVVWLIRVSVFFAVWYSFFLFRFFYVFPKEKISLPAKYTWGLIPLTTLTSILTLTPLVFTEVTKFTDGRVTATQNGPGVFLLAFVIIGLIFGGLALLFKKLLQSEGARRMQYSYIFTGALVTYSSIVILNFILPAFLSNSSFISYAGVLTFPFIAATTYAIMRHHLFDAKVVGTEMLTFLLAVITLFQIPFSQGTAELAVNSLVFVLVLIFGILLVKSVIGEIKSREKNQELAKELKKANKKLKKVDKIKSEFISIASHQLRTPLSVIKGYASMALEGEFGNWKSNEQKEVFQKIFSSSERLIALIEDLLNISRLEQGKVGYNFKKANLTELVEGVVDELEPKAKDKGLDLNFNGPEDPLPEMNLDKDKLRQVFVNLIDNSIKYTDEGNVTVHIDRKNEEKVQVRVADTGAGMSEEDLSSLFQRFSRGKRVTQMYTEGVGLGLYFAKNIVQAHNGKIWATSPGPGKGSTFYVELPIAGKK